MMIDSAVSMAEYLGIDHRYIDSTMTGGSSFEFHVQHAAAAIRDGTTCLGRRVGRVAVMHRRRHREQGQTLVTDMRTPERPLPRMDPVSAETGKPVRARNF
jgi:hypothetical protein